MHDDGTHNAKQPVLDGRRVPVSASDGHAFSLFCAGEPSGVPLLFLPAMGVTSGYYEDFARSLAAVGFFAIVGELRGQGTSSVRPSRSVDYGYREILEFDIPAVTAWLRTETDRAPILSGHSLGGQLGLLAARREGADRVALVSACLPYYRPWPGLGAWGLLGVSYLFDAITGALGMFPGHRLGFGSRDAKTLLMDWTHTIRHGRYQPARSTIDWEAELLEYDRPVMIVRVEGDAWTPAESVDYLLERAANADPVHQVIPSTPGGHPHFTWVRNHQPVVEAFARFAGI